MRKGFTLIELMIVIAIIAIIAAIAIPNLLSGRMSANESSAGAALKLITSSEATWLQQDPDGNGLKDYWTGDVSCLHRMYRADNTTKTAFIAIDLARADAAPLNPTGITTLPFGAPTIEVWTNVVSAVKSGYWFQVMTNNDLSTSAVPGTTYRVNNVGTTAVACGHNSRFGFISAPDAYGNSGINTFIVNQEGTIYGNDTGSDANKWFTSGTATSEMSWPTVNPAGHAGAGGRNWRVAD